MASPGEEYDAEKRMEDLTPTPEAFLEGKEDYFWYTVYDDNSVGCSIWMPGAGSQSPDNIDRDKVKMVVFVPTPPLKRDRVICRIDKKKGERLILFMSKDIIIGSDIRRNHYTVGWETASGRTYLQIDAAGKIHVTSNRVI